MQDKLEQISRLKQELDSSRPLHSTTLASILADLRLQYTYNSNALEGNTLSIYETKVILQQGVTIGGKSLREHLEVINHDKAIDLLLRYVQDKEGLTLRTVLDFHEIILKQIDDEWAGRLRTIPVRIGGAKNAPPAPAKVYDEMLSYMQQMKMFEKTLHPVAYVALVHAHLVRIHPFVDGNGRTARLIMNLELMKNGYPLILIDVLDRVKYCHLLEWAILNDDYSQFIDFIADCTLRSLQIYLSVVNENTLN